VAEFKRLWLNGNRPDDLGKNQATLQNYFKECSWGKVGAGVA
jgi:hypothetical protein